MIGFQAALVEAVKNLDWEKRLEGADPIERKKVLHDQNMINDCRGFLGQCSVDVIRHGFKSERALEMALAEARKKCQQKGFKYDMKPHDRWSDYTYFKDGQIDGIHIKMFAVNPLTGGFVGQTETMNDFQNENPRFSSVYFSSRQSLLDEQEWYKKLLNAVYISNEEAEKGGTEK